MGIDRRAFRDALGTFATGITVVSSIDEGGHPFGLTVNSFNSVSLSPPLVLCSLTRDSNTLEVIRASEKFAVNVLNADQQSISDRFAKNGDDKWVGLEYKHAASNGCPYILNTLATFVCKVAHIYDGGDHEIVVGEVVEMSSAKTGSPLIYFRGSYRGLNLEDT